MPSYSSSPQITNTPAAKFQANSANNGIGNTLLMLLCLIAILVGLYFACKWLAKYAQRGTFVTGGAGKFRPGKHITLVDRLMLDRERAVSLIESDGKRYLIATGRDAVTLLDKYDAPDEEENVETQQTVSTSFKDALSAWKDRTKK